jgi:hypothetical protein
MEASCALKERGARPTYEERCRKLLDLAESLRSHRVQIVRAAARDIQFTVSGSSGRSR